MIKSMTGFGRCVAENETHRVIVEVRSLNSKSLDLSLRLPAFLRDNESAFRAAVTAVIQRGKTEVNIGVENPGARPHSIDKQLAQSYYRDLKRLAGDYEIPYTDMLSVVMAMPGIVKAGDERPETADETLLKFVKGALDKALGEFEKFRKQEGKVLEADVRKRIHHIQEALQKTEALDKKRIPAIKSRLRKTVAEAIGKGKIDENRLEQELVYYCEKLDITEEKIRLKTHCNYFIETAKEDAPGRKLGFVSQEIGREINTIGSKVNDAAIQKLVVQMKDELEKVKEQLMNIL